MRARCSFTSSPGGAYTCTTESTSAYMNFCTSDAWKCPGSSVLSRKRGDMTGVTPSVSVAMAAMRIPIRRMAPRLRELRRKARCTIGSALGAGEHRVRLRVVHESLSLGVPGKGTPELHGDPAQDAGGVATMRYGCRRQRLLTRLYALEPVAVMREAVRQLHRDAAWIEEARVARIERLERSRRGRWIARGCRLGIARHEDPSVVADEANAIRQLVRHGHDDVPRIRELHVIRAMHVPDLVRGELATPFDPAGPRMLQIHAPVRRVEMMGAPPGDHAEAIGVVAKPAGPRVHVGISGGVRLLRVHPLLGVIDLRRRPDPHVVVQVRRDGLRRIVRCRGIGGQADLHATQCANASAGNEFPPLPELLVRSPSARLCS